MYHQKSDRCYPYFLETLRLLSPRTARSILYAFYKSTNSLSTMGGRACPSLGSTPAVWCSQHKVFESQNPPSLIPLFRERIFNGLKISNDLVTVLNNIPQVTCSVKGTLF